MPNMFVKYQLKSHRQRSDCLPIFLSDCMTISPSLLPPALFILIDRRRSRKTATIGVTSTAFALNQKNMCTEKRERLTSKSKPETCQGFSKVKQ